VLLKQFYTSLTSFSIISVALLVIALTPAISHAAVVQIVNINAPGVGFNDPTPFAPVGGNNATTLGQARLNAFKFGANLIGSMLSSAVVIKIQAKMIPMGGTAVSATLGSAGPTTVFRDFAGAPLPNTWYVQALANKLSGMDKDPASNDINARFNSDVDGPVVLGTTTWYYGLDGNPPPGGIEFVTVILHEIIHGLGFLTLVDLATGNKFMGADDAFMKHLEHHGAVPAMYPVMTSLQRIAASTSVNLLHWTGIKTVAANKGLHVAMFAPNPQQPGSSVSHFDEATTPLELMSPFANGVQHNIGMAAQVLEDIGWGKLGAAGAPKRHVSQDYNGDGKSDILFHQASTGRNFMMLMNGRTVLSQGQLRRLPTSWSIVGDGDYNGDGKSDILFHQASTGRNFMMLMNGRTVLSQGQLRRLPASWSIVGDGDYDGDGKSDILFHQASTGRNIMMLMNGRTVLSQGQLRRLPTSWSIVGDGDYNGDGKSDILFHQASTGRNIMMLMNGRKVLSQGQVSRLPASWRVVGDGDYNGDGRSDILFHNASTGRNIMMLMNGRTVMSKGFVSKLPASWRIVGDGDYDGDGRNDILFHKASNGRNFVMSMNGRAVLSKGFVRWLPRTWEVVNIP